MSFGAFWIASAILAGLVGLAAQVVAGAIGAHPPAGSIAAAVISAFLVGTVGWSVVGLGLGRDPEGFLRCFLAGALVKLVLLGACIAAVWSWGRFGLQEYLVELALVFAALFHLQLIWIYRVARREALTTSGERSDVGLRRPRPHEWDGLSQ